MLWGDHTEVLIALIVFIALIALVVPLVPCYPVVIINRVHYLGPPGHYTSQILGPSRGSQRLSWQREREGAVPRGSSRTLRDPP